MPFPSTLSTFTDPVPTDRLSTTPHSSIETSQNTGLREVQAFIGTLSSAVGTLMYDIRAAGSGGGGHVQTAILGGTGQTTFTRGDIFAAANSSTVSRLAIGANNTMPIADTAQATGIRWGSPTRIGSNASVVTVISNTTETSIMSVTISGSVLSTTNAIRGTAYVSAYTASGSADTLTIKANYGPNQVTSILLSPSGASNSSAMGRIEFVLLANADSAVQRGELGVNITNNRLNILASSVLGVEGYNRGTSSVNSNLNQNFGITAQWGAWSAGSRLDIDGYLVEQIL